MKKVLIIIPAYNEEANILKTIKKIDNVKIDKIKIDYIVINDGSTDNTKKILIENNLNHINLINNLGIGGAVQTGYKYALYNDYDIAIQFDGDGQHDANYFKNLIDPILKEDYDFIIGSRFIGHETSFKSTGMRRIGIKVLSFLIKMFTSVEIKDVTSGFRAANKKTIKMFALEYPTDYPEPETNLLVIKKKFKVKEIPVKMFERENGQSSINAFKSIYYMFKVSLAIIIVAISNRNGG